jgi:CheY-like chemotaxis protein
MGYRVTTVCGPEEAMLITDTISFDVVLTDALMPKMDGRELSRRLKEAHGNKIKVVLMTSLYTARHFQSEARHVFKVDEYLAKPLRYAELHDALQRVAPIARRPVDWNVALAS